MLSLTGLIIYLTFELLRPSVLLGTPEPGRVMFWVALVTAAVWGTETLFSSLQFWRKAASTRFLTAFVLWGGLCSLMSGEWLRFAADKFFDLCKILLIYLIAFQSSGTEGRLKTVRFVVLTLILYLGIGGILFTLGYQVPGFSGDHQNRVQYTDILADSNDLGQIYVTGWAMLLYDLLNGPSRFKKPFLLVAVGLMSWAVFLTESRGAILGLIVGLIVAFRKRTGVLLPTVLGLVMLFALNQYQVARMDKLSLEETSAEDRIKSWAQGWYMLRSGPVFGVGPLNFTDYHPKAAHSSLIQVAAETGFIGMFLWLGFFYGPLREAWQAWWPQLQRFFRTPEPTVKDPPFLTQQLQAGLIVCFFTGLFLSRAYILMPYLLAGLAMSSHYCPAAGEPPPPPSKFEAADWVRLLLLMVAAMVVWRILVFHYVEGP